MTSRYSIIIPIYNEERTLPELGRRLRESIGRLDGEVEVILVDDGSRDDSFSIMREMHRKDGRFKVIHLSRNFGHQIAISAGIDLATGDALVLMDGDLQDPPELLTTMVGHWKSGYQVVYTVKRSRKEHRLKRFAFHSFYRLLQALSSVKIPMEAGNFCLLDRSVASVLRSMPERHRYISGMRAWAGFRQIGVEYDRDARYAGKAQMSFGRLVELALDGIFSFSQAPLRMAVYIGLASAGVSFLGGTFVLYEKLFTDRAILGWASTIVSIAFLGGLILMTLGIIGEYIGRIYDEVKQRPLYIIDGAFGFSGRPAQSASRQRNRKPSKQ
jgi:glycosyltransferase involved in cell wall biosynthesis